MRRDLRRSELGVLSLQLMILAALFWSSACTIQRDEIKRRVSLRDPQAEAAVAEAQSACLARPDDPDAARKLVHVYLDAGRYLEALEAAEALQKLEPGHGTNEVLLGRALFGTGDFEAAAGHFQAVLERQPTHGQAALWLATVHSMRGRAREIRSLLTARVEAGADWPFYEMLLSADITPALEDRLSWVTHYRSHVLQTPPVQRWLEADRGEPGGPALKVFAACDDASAVYRQELQALLETRSPTCSDGTPKFQLIGEPVLGKIEDSLRTRSGNALRISHQAPGQVVKLPLTDSYEVWGFINGEIAPLKFDSGADGLLLGERFVRKLRLEPLSTVGLAGFGGVGASMTQEVQVAQVELGSTTLENVTARVLPGWESKDFVGLVGPSVFEGFSYRLDLKEGWVELFPPERGLPPPPPGAVIQPFYRYDHFMLADIRLRDRETGRRWTVKMIVDTGADVTLLDLPYVKRQRIGKLNRFAHKEMRGVTGYSDTTGVDGVELEIGDHPVELKEVWSVELPDLGGVRPYGFLGRDVLSQFRVTVDVQRFCLVLEPRPPTPDGKGRG